MENCPRQSLSAANLAAGTYGAWHPLTLVGDAVAVEPNLVAAVSAFAFGLSALVPALYGAPSLPPLKGPRGPGDDLLLLPLLVAGVLAAVVAALLPASAAYKVRPVTRPVPPEQA